MTEQLPAPLVPPEVDLRDFQFMPLYGDILLDSETWLLCEAEEKVAALTLWWKSWHQLPAGSLPDNDKLLAPLAGYGVAVKVWQTVKPMAMRGWVLCSDGRYYHRFLAVRVADAWLGKLRKNWSRECDRIRKENKKLEEKQLAKREFPSEPSIQSAGFPPEIVTMSIGSDATFRRMMEAVPAETGSKSAGVPRKEEPIPSKNPLKGEGQGIGDRGQGESKKEPPSEDEAGASLGVKVNGYIDEGQTVARHAEPDEMPLYLVRPRDGDWSIVLFRQGLAWLVRTTRNNPAGCRSLIGKWLKAAKNDHRRVFNLMAQAQLDRIADPRAWITAALEGKAGDFSIVNVLKEMADDERNTERREGGDDPADGNALPPPEAGRERGPGQALPRRDRRVGGVDGV